MNLETVEIIFKFLWEPGDGQSTPFDVEFVQVLPGVFSYAVYKHYVTPRGKEKRELLETMPVDNVETVNFAYAKKLLWELIKDRGWL